jgi:hypothetical protein
LEEFAMRRHVCLAMSIVLSVAAVSLAGISRAQDEALPKPGEEHAHLKAMAGDWDTVSTMIDGTKSKGEMTSEMTCGGLWLASSFKSEFGGIKFEGRGLDSYDPAKKKFVSVWVDSMTTSPMMLEGTWDESTKKLTMMGNMTTPDGKQQKVKTVTTIPDNDHQKFELFMTLEGQETPVMTVDYTRRK